VIAHTQYIDVTYVKEYLVEKYDSDYDLRGKRKVNCVTHQFPGHAPSHWRFCPTGASGREIRRSRALAHSSCTVAEASLIA